MSPSTVGGGGFNRYAAGRKQYGMGRNMPTMGKVDPIGYAERDATANIKRNAILRRLQAGLGGRYASPDFGRFVGR
jgi:hypothetical protein